jgi:hypothetical protein
LSSCRSINYRTKENAKQRKGNEKRKYLSLFSWNARQNENTTHLDIKIAAGPFNQEKTRIKSSMRKGRVSAGLPNPKKREAEEESKDDVDDKSSSPPTSQQRTVHHFPPLFFFPILPLTT